MQIFLLSFINTFLLILANGGEACTQFSPDPHTTLVRLNEPSIYIFVDRQDQGISKFIRENHKNNHNIEQLIIKYLKDGHNFIHVGPHIGIQTLLVAQFVKKNHMKIKIYAIEPNQLNYVLLTKSIYINEMQDHIRVYKAAITEVEGVAEIAIKNSDTSKAQIIQTKAETKRKSDYKYEVETTTIDKLLGNKIGTEKFGIIYISANTMQVQVMIGMKKLLELNKALVVIAHWDFQSNWHKNVDGLINVLTYFRQNNYRVYKLLAKKEQNVTRYQSYQLIDNSMDLMKIGSQMVIFIPASQNAL